MATFADLIQITKAFLGELLKTPLSGKAKLEASQVLFHELVTFFTSYLLSCFTHKCRLLSARCMGIANIYNKMYFIDLEGQLKCTVSILGMFGLGH